jgi:hypothetical protein
MLRKHTLIYIYIYIFIMPLLTMGAALQYASTATHFHLLRHGRRGIVFRPWLIFWYRTGTVRTQLGPIYQY